MTAPTRALTVGLILSVLSPAASSAAPRQPSSAQQKRISVEYRGDLRDALKAIATKGGLNLVVTGKLDQDAEVFLKDVTAEEALRTVAQAYQLKIQQSGSIWTLRPLTEAEIAAAPEEAAAPSPPPGSPPGHVGPHQAGPRPGQHPAGMPVPPIPPVPPLPPIVSGMPQQDIEAAMREAEAVAERAEADAEAAVERAEEEAERLREQADEAGVGARAQADEMRERAQELRERAQEARERAREARQHAREALREARRSMKNERVGTGSVVVAEGEVVQRAVAYGGSLTINGHVEDDAVAIGGSIALGPKAWVEGDVVAIGGSIARAEGAVVEGDVEALGGSIVGEIVKNSFKEVRDEVRNETRSTHRDMDPVAQFLVWFMVLFGTGFLGHLLVPQRMKLIQTEVRLNPLKSGLSGVLGTLALFPLTLLLVVTLVGIPIALLVLWPAAFLGAALGFTAVASELGTRLPVFRGKKTQAVVMALGLGVMLLASLVPLLGPIAMVLLAFIGFGAVVRTRFGSRSSRPGGPLDAANIPDATPA